MIDLKGDEIKIIFKILNQYAPNCEVRVFGSRVKGKAKKYSDLDIALVGEQKFDWKLIADIKEAFQESDLIFRVDVLDWYAISPEFRKIIECKYEVLEPHSFLAC